jgi:hypothetical protein
MPIHGAGLSTFEEPVAPFQEVVANELLQVHVGHSVRDDHSLETPFGRLRGLKTTFSSQVGYVRLQSFSHGRAFNVAYRGAR